jgi:signal transduction histidine kinase
LTPINHFCRLNMQLNSIRVFAVDSETRYRQGSLTDIALNPMVAGMESPVIHALLCATDYGILMSDKHGNDIVCNPRFGELFDVDPEHVVHSSRAEVRKIALSRVKDPEAFNTLVERIYADPTLEHEDEIELATTPPRVLSRYTGPVYDISGENIGRVWTFQDVTETRKLQREVKYYASALEKQLEQQKDDLRTTSDTLRVLSAISAALPGAADMDMLVASIADILSSYLSYHSAALLLNRGSRFTGVLQKRGGTRRRVDVSSTMDDLLKSTSQSSSRGLSGGPMFICLDRGKLLDALGFERAVGSLLFRDSQVIGLLLLGTTDTEGWEVPPPVHWKAIVDQVGMALETLGLNSQLQSAYDELREAQSKMVESAKLGAVGTLAAAVAHDIRNIMTPLQLELSLAGPSANIGTARSQVDRLSALTHRLLGLTKPSELHPMPLDVQEVVEHILPLILAQADVDGVAIRTRFSKNIPPVHGDSARLEHLFINLFLNALNAMSVKGGTLSISTRKSDEGVCVIVTDTGYGIDKAQLSKLFQPFFTTRANGSGLGLFSVKCIIDEHKGRIDVKSAPGKGTTFSVWLPVSPEPPGLTASENAVQKVI